MQHLMLVLAILLLTVIVEKGSYYSETKHAKATMVLQPEKIQEKKIEITEDVEADHKTFFISSAITDNNSF